MNESVTASAMGEASLFVFWVVLFSLIFFFLLSIGVEYFLSFFFLSFPPSFSLFASFFSLSLHPPSFSLSHILSFRFVSFPSYIYLLCHPSTSSTFNDSPFNDSTDTSIKIPSKTIPLIRFFFASRIPSCTQEEKQQVKNNQTTAIAIAMHITINPLA